MGVVFAGNSIASIPKDCFKGFSNLRFAILPNSVKTIGDSAFSDCHQLRDIVMPGVTSIGAKAFENTVSLLHVSLPSGITNTNVANNAFTGAVNLRDVEKPDGVAATKFPYAMNLYPSTARKSYLYVWESFSLGAPTTSASSENDRVTSSKRNVNHSLTFCYNNTLSNTLATAGGDEVSYTTKWYFTGLDGAEDKSLEFEWAETTEYHFPESIDLTAARENIAYDFLGSDGTKYINTFSGDTEVTEYDIAKAACYNVSFTRIFLPAGDTVKVIGDWAFYGSQTEVARIPAGVEVIGQSAFRQSHRRWGGTSGKNSTIYIDKAKGHDLKVGSYAFALGVSWSMLPTSKPSAPITNATRRFVFTDSEAYLDELGIKDTSATIPSVAAAKSTLDAKYNTGGDGTITYTYQVPVYTSVVNGDTEDKQLVGYRLFNNQYRFTMDANQSWTAKSADTLSLPTLDGFKSNVWYQSKAALSAPAEGNQVDENFEYINRQLALAPKFGTVSEIVLYTKFVDAPTVTQPISREFSEEISQNPAEALSLDKGENDINYDVSLTSFTPFVGDPDQDRGFVHDAGTYSLRVLLDPRWGEWDTTVHNHVFTVTVTRAEIDLGDPDNLPEFVIEGSSPLGGSGSGTSLYRYTDGWYLYAKSTGSPESSKTVLNAYARYTGNPITIAADTTGLRYSSRSDSSSEVTETRSRENLAGFTFDMQDPNYVFSYRAHDGADEVFSKLGVSYGNLSLGQSGLTSVTVSKYWYIVMQQNWLIDSNAVSGSEEQFNLLTKDGVPVSSFEYESVFGEESGQIEVHIPKIARGPEDTAITFTVTYGANELITQTETPVSELKKYINAAMPAGTYTVRIMAGEVDDGTTILPAINDIVRITVTNGTLDSAAIETLLTGKSFEHLYEQNAVHMFSDEVQAQLAAEIAKLNAKLNAVRKGLNGSSDVSIWGGAEYNRFYNDFAITYNLDRLQTSEYFTVSQLRENYPQQAPVEVGQYNIYYALSALNYSAVGGMNAANRRAYIFGTTIYRELSAVGLLASSVDELYYTGNTILPTVNYNPYYRHEFPDAEYVNKGNHTVTFTITDTVLTRWSQQNVPANVTIVDNVATLTFEILAVTNAWTVAPQIPSWSFDGFNAKIHRISSSLRFGEASVVFRIDKEGVGFVGINGSVIPYANVTAENVLEFTVDEEGRVDDAVAAILTALKPDTYRLYSAVSGYENGNVNGFETAEQARNIIVVSQAVNRWTTSPNIVRWNWSEYNQTKNTIAGTPLYLNVADLTGLKVKFTVLDSQYKAIEGLIGFTLDGAEYAAVCAKLGSLDAGNYYLLATVNKTDYYTGLNELPELVEGGTLLNGDGLDPIPFDIAQKNNYWQVSPAMTAWRYEQFATANFREGEPAFPTTGKKVYYGIFENDITEKPVSVDAFNSLAGGKMFESIADVETYLRELHQGDYYLAAYAAGDNNYTDLFMTVRFNVLTVENGWQTTPGITSWKYKGFTDANFIAGVPTYPKTNAQVTYGVFQTETAPEVSAFATCEHKFTDVAQLKAYLGDLEKSTYYLAAYVEKAANEDYDYLYLALRFTVDTATNSWETEPRLTGWTYKSFTEDNFTAGLATLRDNPETKVTYQILDENGTVKIGPFTDLAAVKEEINALGANKDTTKSYTLVVSYAGTTNYEDLTSRIPFRVTKANNSWQTTPGLTGWTFNTFTTANFTEGKAAFNEGNNYIQYVIKKSDGTQVVAFTNDPTGINIETVKSTLETLPYGHYSLDATLEGTDDHTGLEQLNITFQVTQMGNSWKTTPNLVGWQYKAFAEGNFTAGNPNYIAQGTVPQYGVFTANLNNSTEFTETDAGVKFETLNDEVTVDGKTMTVAKYLEELTVRTGTDAYYFAAYVPADGNDNYGELFLCVPFRVTPATTNAWTEAPSIGGWTYGDTQPGALLTKGTAAFGELVYSIHLSDAQGNPGAVVSGYEELSYDELVAKLNGAENQLSAVNYNLVVTTVENINYNTITYNVRFAVEKADNAWATVPTINGWTYGATAETPIEGITAHEPDEGQKSMAYYPAQQVNGVWVANTTAGAIENIATAGAGTYAYVFTAGETTNYKEVTHTAIFVISQKGNAWTVEPEGTLTWVWGFAEIGNTKLATAAAEENGDGVQYSIRNTQTNSIENPAGATIAEKLSNLGAGDYEITTSVGATDNYAGISKITYLTVTKANFVVESEILNTYGWEWDDATGGAIFGNPSITKAKETDAALVTYIVTTESGRAETFTDYDLMSAHVLALGAGKHEIKITVTNSNYNDYTKTVAVNIGKATFSVTEKQTDTSWSWNENWTAEDGGRTIIPTTVLDKKNGQVEVQYAIGERTFADFDELKTYLQGNRNVGKYTVAVSVAQEGYENYNDLGVSFTVTVTQAENRWLTEPQTELKKEYGRPLDALVLAQAAFGTLTYTGYDPESGKTLLEWINELPSGTHTLTTGVAADDNGNYKGLTPITTVITVVGIGGTWDNENDGLRREYEFTYSSKLSEQMATVKIPVKTWDQYEELNGLPEDKSPKLTYSVTYVPYIGEAVSPVLDNTQTAVINYLGSAARQAGTYTIQVDYNPNNPNYATLSYTVTVRVLRSEISWATQPDGLYNKPYAGFEADVLTPNAGEGHKVVYDVSGTVNESNVAITDFRAYLNGLSVGEYTITYSVEETNNYTGLETQTVTVTIYKAANDWVDATILQKSHTAYRINGNYDTLVVPEALYGTVVTTLTAPDGRTSAPVYNETIKTFADWLASQNLAAGEYGISFAVAGTENYNGLLYECTLSVLKKDNAWTTDGEPVSSYEWTGAAGTFKIPTPEVGATLLRFDITKAGDAEYTQTHQNLTQKDFETAIAALSYGTYTVTIRVGSDKGEEEPTAAIRNHNNDYNILIGTTTIVFERAENAFTTELSAIVKTFGTDVTLAQPVAKKGGETVVYTISGTTANGVAVATQTFAANDFAKFVAAINGLEAGTYTMTASIAQTNTYEAATTTAIVTVNKVTTEWNLTDDELNAYKGNLAFTWNNGAVPSDLLPELALSNWAQGVIRYTVDGKECVWTTELGTKDAGSYRITAYVEGDNNHTALSFETTVVINPVTTAWTAETAAQDGERINWIYKASTNMQPTQPALTQASIDAGATITYVLANAENGAQLDSGDWAKVTATLAAQTAGTYTITAAVVKGTNHTALTFTSTVVISVAANDWKPNGHIGANATVTWVYGHHADNAAIVYEAEHNNDLLAITVNNVAVSGNLMDYLKAQSVGTYVIVASVPATAEYGALTETITLTIGKSTDNGWTNGGLVINDTWTWTDVSKHTADDMAGYYVGAELGLVVPIPKYGDRVLITVMSGATELFSTTVLYENGVANEAIVNALKNRLWALDAGSYTIIAQIPESENYAQSEESAVSFTVAQATNVWLESPAIGGWDFGGTTVYPTALPKFGNKNDVVYMYAPKNGREDITQILESEWKTALPTQGGAYFIRGTLEGTNNYTALDKDAVNCYSTFSINTGDNAWVNNVSVVSWNWDGYNREANLFGGSARSGGIVHYVIKKLVSGSEAVLDKDDFSIEITQEEWEKTIEKRLSDITLTEESDYKFVSEEIAALLNALKPGNYVLNAVVNADENYGAISAAVNFTVGKATNDWATNADGSAKLPGVVSFTYGAPVTTGDRVSFTAGEAKYGSVNYKITGTKNDETSYESAVLHTTDKVYDLFGGLDAGNYVLNVWFDADESLYSALYSAQSPYVLPFNVARANNSWNTTPATRLTEKYSVVQAEGFDFGAWFGTPAAAHEDIVYTILGTDFTTALAGEYSYANLYNDAILKLGAGEYIVRLTVGQSCNYNALTADISLTLTRLTNSFTSIPSSFTGEWHLDADGVSNNSTIAITETTVTAEHGTIVYTFDNTPYTTVAGLQNAIKACNAGSYQITVSVEANNYYDGLTRTVQLDIAQGTNAWKDGWNVGTSLKAGNNVMSWAWNSAAEWTKGVPVYGTTVYVEIMKQGTTTALRRIPVDYSVDGGASSIEAVNTFVSGLDKGLYTIVVTAPATANWSELKTRAEDAVFEVTQAANGWETEPYLYNATENKYVYGTVVQPYAEALHGTVEYKYYAKTTSGYSPLATVPVNAGDYKVEFIVTEPSTGNYAKIEGEIDFTIEKAEVTSYIVSPSASGWIWNGYNRLSNLFTAIPTSGGAVTYSILNSNGTVVIADIRLADALGVHHGDFDKDIYVTAAKAQEIAALDAGRYTLRVDVAEVANYKSFYTTVNFDITEAENTWIVAPQLVGWAQNNWNAEDYTPMATSRFGEVTIYVRNKINGDVYYERSYNSATGKYEVKINQLNLAKAGRLVMTASVAKSPNQYHATNEDGEFVDLEGSIEVEIYPVGSSENNVWLTSPGIVGWEANVEAPVNLPYGEPLRGWAYFVFYDAEGHEIVAGEDSYLVEKGDSYYRDFYVPMAPGTYRMEAFAVNEDIEGNVIEADNLHARNITLIISHRKNSFTLEPRIPTLLYLGEKNDKTKWVDPTATAALADSTITFTYTLKETGEEYHDLNDITKDGTYTLKAVVEAKYCIDLTFTVDFEVALSQNSWIDIPVVKDWSEEDGPVEPEGKPEFGEIVYEYFEKRGDELIALEGKPTREGSYVLRATAYQEGFTPLVNEFEFTVTPTFDSTLLAVDISLACVLCALTVVVIVFAIRRYKENG